MKVYAAIPKKIAIVVADACGMPRLPVLLSRYNPTLKRHESAIGPYNDKLVEQYKRDNGLA